MGAGHELRDLLRKAFEVTKKLQFADCTPGYFYKKWSGLRIYYEVNGSLLATEIDKSMEKREPELLNNGLLLAAVLIDINNMDLLSENNVQKAREATVDLVLRMKGLQVRVCILENITVGGGGGMEQSKERGEKM